MATFRKRKDSKGNQRWQALIRLKGHLPITETFNRKEDATRWAKQKETEIKNGEHFGNEATKHTLSDAIDRYLKEFTQQRDRRERERHLKWWSEQLGHLTLSQVTPAAISECKSTLVTGSYARSSQDGAKRFKRSPASVNRYLSSLSHLLSVADKEWQWISKNPMPRVAKLKEPRGRVRFLSDEERAALLKECRESRNRHLYPAVMLALVTGARRNELLTLRWADIDAKRRVAIVHETKNGERRVLPLATPAWAALEDHGKVRILGAELVFPSHDGKKPANIEEAWRAALKRANLKDFKFHDLRHSCASYLAMNGATPGEIAEILGHRTLQMVKRYAHLSEKHVSSVVERMAGNVFK